MTLAGWIFLISSWTGIIVIAICSFAKTFSNKDMLDKN